MTLPMSEQLCYCGYALDEDIHEHTGSVWCFPDEPEVDDRAAVPEDVAC